VTQEYLKIHLGNHYCSSEGVGLGRHIEESVQNSTGENLILTEAEVEMTP
jgi:hypothetical protein